MSQTYPNPGATAATILVVDDNPQNVELFQAQLETLPVRVITAYDGVQALEQVAQHDPDLILLDVMMPRMNGLQVCKRLKADSRTCHIQILMTSALAESKDIHLAHQCGSDGFVAKPIGRTQLLQDICSRLGLT